MTCGLSKLVVKLVGGAAIKQQLDEEHKLSACVLNEPNSRKGHMAASLTPLIPSLHFYSKPRPPFVLLILSPPWKPGKALFFSLGHHKYLNIHKNNQLVSQFLWERS